MFSGLSYIKIIITDDITVVSIDCFIIFTCNKQKCWSIQPFTGLSVIAVSFQLQLPSVGGRTLYSVYKNYSQNVEPLRKYFNCMN